jgi:hypothetical protein
MTREQTSKLTHFSQPKDREASQMAAVTAHPSFLASRRGKLTLALLCAVAFLDFIDASIVNIALPSIRRDLHFSVQSLVWIPGGYLLTYSPACSSCQSASVESWKSPGAGRRAASACGQLHRQARRPTAGEPQYS